MSGIVGVFSLDGAGRDKLVDTTYAAMRFNQHRGEEGASLITARDTKESFATSSGKGFIDSALGVDLPSLRAQEPVACIGYNVYETNIGEKPVVVSGKKYKIALVMDGHILGLGPNDKSMEVAEFFSKHLEGTNDLHETGRRFMDEFFGRGSYCITMLVNDGEQTRQVVMRDPFGIKPLCIGMSDDVVVVSSETVGLQGAKAEFKRYIEPGEFLVLSKGITESDLEKPNVIKSYRHAHCSFEYIYYTNIASESDGINSNAFRQNMARALEDLYPDVFSQIDMAICSPDSGRGLLSGSRKRPEEVIIKLPGARRIFQIDNPELRMYLASLKWAINEWPILKRREELGRDVSLGLYDDSIVRNTNCYAMIEALRSVGGVGKVYIIPSCPPLCFPRIRDFENLSRGRLAAEGMYGIPVEDVGRRVADDNGSNGVLYPTIEVMRRELKLLGADDVCTGCFDGKYPASRECLDKHCSNLPVGYSSLID